MSARPQGLPAAAFGSLALVVAALLAFAGLAVEMAEGETLVFDHAILLALRDPDNASIAVGPPWLTEVARDVTSLGSTTVITAITLAVAGYLVLANSRLRAALVVCAVVGGAILSTLLKLGFQRPRPELAPDGLDLLTDSFPSGHAMLSAVTYLTLGVLLAQFQARWTMRIYIMALATSATIFVGLSRIYLGVHWPTDVLAGWCLGASWAVSCWLVASSIATRASVEFASERHGKM